MSITLRPIKLEDGSLIVKWRNTPAVLAHCLNQNPITLESNEKFFYSNIETGKYLQFIVELEDKTRNIFNEPIATCYLKDIDKTNKRCELCIFTSDNQEWNTESQTEAIKILLDKAFAELGMHKVYSYIFYKFMDEAALLRNAGFEIEAVLKNEALGNEGSFDDVIRFCMIR